MLILSSTLWIAGYRTSIEWFIVIQRTKLFGSAMFSHQLTRLFILAVLFVGVVALAPSFENWIAGCLTLFECFVILKTIPAFFWNSFTALFVIAIVSVVGVTGVTGRGASEFGSNK